VISGAMSYLGQQQTCHDLRAALRLVVKVEVAERLSGRVVDHEAFGSNSACGSVAGRNCVSAASSRPSSNIFA